MGVNIVLRKATNTYRVKIVSKGVDGVWRTHWLPGSFSSLSAAKAKKAETELAIAKGADAFDAASVGSFLAEWVRLRASMGRIGVSSVKPYAAALGRLSPFLGTLALATLTARDVQVAYQRVAEAHGLRAAVYTHRVFSAAIKSAVKDGRVLSNPLERIEPPRARIARKPTTLTPAQIATALAHAGDDAPLLSLLAATGLRVGEASGLQWRDFDFAANTVRVERILAQATGGRWVVKPPKTEAGSRVVALDRAVMDLFRGLRGALGGTISVFGGANPHQLAGRVERVLDRAGLEHFSTHDLRHAHATHLLRNKANVKAVSRRLGHADVRITLSTYAHVLDGDDENLAALGGALVKQEG